MGNIIFGDLDLTFKVDPNIISDLDLTHSMVLIIHCLVLLQIRVIRLICGAKRLDHTNLLFNNVHILNIPDLLICGDKRLDHTNLLFHNVHILNIPDLLICGDKRLDHTNFLFHNVHILKIPDLVKLKTVIIMFKA